MLTEKLYVGTDGYQRSSLPLVGVISSGYFLLECRLELRDLLPCRAQKKCWTPLSKMKLTEGHSIHTAMTPERHAALMGTALWNPYMIET